MSRLSYRSCRRWTAIEARAALTALAASGLSIGEFAVQEGLDPQRLRAWQRKLGAAVTTRPAFIEVRSQVAERIEVVLRSGVILRVAETVDPVALGHLVETLDRASSC